MIRWDELKHFHAIRKLEGILAQWFNSDLFFVNDKGEVQNFELHGSTRDFHHPLLSSLFSKEAGRKLFAEHLRKINDEAFKHKEKHLTVPGVFGFEKLHVANILIDGEYLGCVVGFAFVDHVPHANEKEASLKFFREHGLDADHLEFTFGKLKSHSPQDFHYYTELLNLVAEEVATYHTEITLREKRIHDLNSQLGERYKYDSMIGKSKPMQSLYSLLDKIQTSEATVLVQGENGTGKELIARSIHFNSTRKNHQFVTVNCSAFNENLLDSELFGHVKGSFTGAIKDKKGLFEAADKGTLFLDEIGDMSPTMQVKLLRVLQEGQLTPVGGTDVRTVDVRVVAATHRNLKRMVEEGSFREDLYYRINVINIAVPALRDRKEDIPVLVDFFIERGCKEKNIPLKAFAKRALEKFFEYPWPGNIRELQNEVERCIVLSGDDLRIPFEVLSQRMRDHGEKTKIQGVRLSGKLKDALEELEITMIKEGLRRTNWNKSKLAKELGISRAGLIMKVEKYGLDKRKGPRPGEAA